LVCWNLSMHDSRSKVPVVSVFMPTYNQGKYISQAIESVLMQRTDFPYKLFIGEDCSTDKTRDICVSYEKKYPEKIELLLNDRNLGPMLNSQGLYAGCFNSGAKYVALLEGDDYWIDARKLQKQVDFLEKNREYALCAHRIEIINQTKPASRLIEPRRLVRNTYTIHDLLRGNFLRTPSIVLRNGRYLVDLPAGRDKIRLGDWMLFILAAQFGKVYIMPDIMAVYRIHEKGIHSTKPTKYKVEVGIELFELLNKYLPALYEQRIKEQLRRYYISMLGHAIKAGKWREIEYYLSKSKSLDKSTVTRCWFFIRAFFVLFFKAVQFYKRR
jgi:glycosyltransferase involved in cell wall biosynthesis